MELVEYVSKLVSQQVISCITGGGAGSILHVKFAPSLHSFMIYCAWRIELNGQVLATSSDDRTAVTGRIARTARLLENQMVKSADMSEFFDLILRFDSGYILRVFCDESSSVILETKERRIDENWYMTIPDQDLSFDVGTDFRIKKGSYYSNED